MSLFKFRIPDQLGDLSTVESRIRASGLQLPRWWLRLAEANPKRAAIVVRLLLRTGILPLLVRLGALHKAGREHVTRIAVGLASIILLALITWLFFATPR